MSERISGADLRLFESAPDYHLARCSRCGVVVVVEKGLDAFACACASLAPPVSVLRGGFTPTHVTTTPTGRRLHEIIDEVRRLRGLVERMDTAIEHSLSEPAGQRVLYLSQASPEFFIEARAIREEQGVADDDLLHGWRCWFRGWRVVEWSPRGAWLVEVCRRCGKRRVSLLGIFMGRS